MARDTALGFWGPACLLHFHLPLNPEIITVFCAKWETDNLQSQKVFLWDHAYRLKNAWVLPDLRGRFARYPGYLFGWNPRYPDYIYISNNNNNKKSFFLLHLRTTQTPFILTVFPTLVNFLFLTSCIVLQVLFRDDFMYGTLSVCRKRTENLVYIYIFRQN